jgi:hypothetical protein
VTITTALDAGLDATVQACESENCLNLFDALGGTPQTGGNWIDLGGSGALFGPCFNATLVPVNTTWQFRYILSSSAGCLRDSATVTVDVVDGPNAGVDDILFTCTNSSPFSLPTPISLCDPERFGL